MIELFHDMAVYILSGGVIMIPIIFISVVMWILIFNRIFFMQGLYVNNISRQEAGILILENRMPDKSRRGINSLIVREFLAERSFDPELDDFILDEIVIRLLNLVDQYIAAIAVLASVTPLLGLLGTVIGMMNTFDAITSFGIGNIQAMASGISVALITTQTGLMVSIPGFYMSGWLKRRAANQKRKISATGIYLKRYL